MRNRPLHPVMFLLLAVCCVQPALAASGPEAFRGLPREAVTRIEAGALGAQAGRDAIRLPGLDAPLAIVQRHRHANGDESLRAVSADGAAEAVITLGTGAAFGQVDHDGRRWQLTTDAGGAWLVALPRQAQYNACATKPPSKGSGSIKPTGLIEPDPIKAPKPAGLIEPDPIKVLSSHAPGTIIDLMIVYNDAFAQRYPGGLLATRVNHLVHLANQAMANSAIDLGFRLVDLRLVPYSNENSNADALQGLATALGGGFVPGLAGLGQARQASGADLVILLRPHDVELRGSCGVAYFPDGNPVYGVNVVSDGMSSWSVCTDDVMVHEIGHNLGASHQAGFGGGNFDPRGAAFVLPGQATTMMASFGTGRPDRFRGLPAFSSPAIQCAGRACGDAADTDNAAVIRDLMGLVAGYQGASSAAALPDTLARADGDADQDGVSDWQDAFPFDAAEITDSDGDGVGDLADAFPADALEQRDTDADGTGDHADADDDGDGVADAQDAFPLLAAESVDSDGDGVGDFADDFPVDPAEFRDSDADGEGDNADPDDDSDGLPELDPLAEDLLVVSAGNGRVLRFDAATGAPRGIEVAPADSLLTFQSDLAWRAVDNTLLYLGDSGVRRTDYLMRMALGEWVPPYDDQGGARLDSGFPNGLALLDGGETIAVSRNTGPVPALFTGRERAVLAAAPAWTPPDSPNALDVATQDETAWVLMDTGRIYRFDADNTVTSLPGSVIPNLLEPRRLLAPGDGRLLVSDRGRNAVIALDTASGEAIGPLASLAGTGYREPDGLALTAQGELLVASAAGDAVLAFDATDGTWLGVRVAPGAWGLDEPRAMTVAPALLDRYPRDATRQFRPNAGLWYDPASSGRGFDIQVFEQVFEQAAGTRLTAIWYAYDEDGQPTWYYADGDLEGFAFDAPLLRFRRDASEQASSEVVGSVSLRFSSERTAGLSYTYGAHQGLESLRWLAFDPEPAAYDHTGLWGRADGPGWGLSIARQGATSVAVAFIYDATGAPRWMLSQPAIGESPLAFDMLAYTSDSLCLSCSGVSGYQFVNAGGMLLQLPPQSPSWSSDVAWPAPLAGDWTLAALPLRRFSSEPEAPR